jgi:hypothetical protein
MDPVETAELMDVEIRADAHATIVQGVARWEIGEAPANDWATPLLTVLGPEGKELAVFRRWDSIAVVPKPRMAVGDIIHPDSLNADGASGYTEC